MIVYNSVWNNWETTSNRGANKLRKPTHGIFRMAEAGPGKYWVVCRSYHLSSWGWGRKFYCNYRSHLPLWEIEMWKLAPVETENTNLNEHILCQETLNRIQMASLLLAAPRPASQLKNEKEIQSIYQKHPAPGWVVGLHLYLYSKLFKVF